MFGIIKCLNPVTWSNGKSCKNILALTHEEIMDFFMETERCYVFKLIPTNNKL